MQVGRALRSGRNLGEVVDQWPVLPGCQAMMEESLMERYGTIIKRKFRPNDASSVEAIASMFKIANWLHYKRERLNSKFRKLCAQEDKQATNQIQA